MVAGHLKHFIPLGDRIFNEVYTKHQNQTDQYRRADGCNKCGMF